MYVILSVIFAEGDILSGEATLRLVVLLFVVIVHWDIWYYKGSLLALVLDSQYLWWVLYDPVAKRSERLAASCVYFFC